MVEPTLYERIGGIYAIAAVLDHFSDQLLKNPKVVDANPELKEWHTVTFAGRLPGLKFLRTLWVASLAGGPLSIHGQRAARRPFRLEDPTRGVRRGRRGAWPQPRSLQCARA